jgi:RimJ/RimL family protein N-acetyltransferase
MIPVLETERLVLRGYLPDDFESFARFMADPDVTRYLTGEPLSRDEAWRSLSMIAGHWLLRGYGMWAVERKADRAFIGRVGLWNPEGWPSLEVGWTLGKPFWGQGYATEAASVAMEYGFLTQNVSRLISVIDPRNQASQSVAARLGETKGPRHDVVRGGKTFVTDIWSISRDAWRKRSQA